jgi:hypothetical protein
MIVYWLLLCRYSTFEQLQTGRPEFIFVGEHSAIDFADPLSALNGEGTEHLSNWPWRCLREALKTSIWASSLFGGEPLCVGALKSRTDLPRRALPVRAKIGWKRMLPYAVAAPLCRTNHPLNHFSPRHRVQRLLA